MSNTKDIFEIEVYREYTIKYDADKDKFFVSFMVNDQHKDTNRKSLKDMRKAIDEYIKVNFEFKPFLLIHKSYGSATCVKLIGIRKDNGFILESDKYRRTEISSVIQQLKGKVNYFFEYNEQYLEWLENKAEIEKRHMIESAEIRRQEPKLTPLDLSFVNQINGNV